MKRITTLIVSMLLIASSVWARTPEEAAAIASGFMSQKGTDASVVQRVQRAKSTGVAQSTVSLEYIQATKANDNAVYVFNHTDGGFVLVSAIDNSREVLGYNDNGRFDKNNIPKNMQFWLQMYADELASVDKTATRSVSAKAATSTYTAVSPILACTWGQSWPYNEMCPTIGSDHAVTGCVATAISQIMYAHKHPAKGTGSHSYTSETNNITSSVNFGSTTYDWNNMLPYYDWYYQENYTDAQVSAVATLLYHVGVSSNMDYGVDGSGAYSGEALYNMTEYFDYDKAINPMSKDVMPEADILTAISNDLQLGRPVYISGSTVNNEGHAFVCDGIRQDGYLHINWGWDGYSDGYFALSALNPEDQGTGGSSDDSAFTQLVVVYSNIKPDEGGAAVSYITCDSYTRTSGNTLTLGASNVNYRLTTLMNNGLVAADGSIYYDIYNSSNQLQHSLPVMEIGLAPNYYYTNALTLAETLPSSMANGEYQLEVCYHDANGNIFPIWVAGLGELPRVAFSVSGNTAYFGEEVELPEVSTVPTAEDLAEYEQDGYFVACINFQGEVCNDIVFAGSYNSWDTYPENMVHFTPLEDFDGWYVAVIPVTVNEEGVEANEGKPVQLDNDGSFSWDYQTGDVNSWELISGSVDITAGYSGESDCKNWTSVEPVILKSLYFKNHNSPCHVVSHEYTVNLIAPSCGGYEPAIIGSFNGWSEGVAMWLQSDGSYSYIFTDNEGGSFKFKATTDTDWSNEIQILSDGVWINNPDILLGEEINIHIDYSDGRYTLCDSDDPTPCYTLNLDVTEGGYVNTDPYGECYTEGTQITLTAEAYEGYQFSQWSDGNTDNPRLLTMTEDIYLTAVFTYTPIEEHSYTIRVKKDDVSDMDISNGLYLWWWYNDQAGQLANMTLGDDGWYTTTITTTANSINCLAVNTDVVNNGWKGQQTIDYTNITGDVCLAIGAKDWIYNYNYNLYEIPCSPMEYTKEHDFEDTEANAQWRFVQNGQTNYWTIGSAAGSMDSGSNALYITSDGNNYTYNNNASSTSWAYIPVTVTAIDSITFYWKGEGESYCDDLQVYLFPKGCTPIAGSTYIPNSAIQLGEYLSGQTDWQYFSAMAGVDGEYNLCLRWYNDGSIGEMPIAVDNMAITTPLNTTEYPLTYVLNEDGTATVVKCATDYSGNVSIPTVVTYNGTTYTVTSIGDNAFNECGYLTSVTIPNSVTSIGRMAFANCWSLESVILSENISRIEDYTFFYCESLTSITIPNNVTYVGNCAFEYGYNLSAVTFGDNVTTIDNYAFASCSSLSSVTIPASVSYIGYSTFGSCNSLNSIVVESGNTAYDSRNNCNAIIETASNTLIAGCQSTIIPETVTTIGYEAFYGCDGLTTIVIPNSVTSIGYSAFAYCYAMTSVTIPASVTEIGSWAFYDCPTIVMEGTTPPTISSSTFKSEATIFVPCTALDTYLATSVWQDLNLQGSNYTVTLSATEGGYAQITASDCATNTVTIEAYPEERYVFTQWSDGNTDNPRILTLTEDIALTAEFTTFTYPVTNLVVTTNCGTAYASWESDAPWFEVAAFDANGDYVLYDIVTYKVGVSNSQPFADGEYTWQVTPMYSDIEGDYAGGAVQAPFTISADNCVDLGVYNLNYTINGETVNITWESEAPLYHIWMCDYNYNVLEEKFIDTKNYSITLSEVGQYHFGIRGNNADATQYSEYSELDIDFVNDEIPYDLNFVYGEQQDKGTWNDAYQRPILLYSEDYQTVMRIYPMPKYENSIIGTYFVENNTDNLYAGGMWGDGSYITYKGISTGAIQSGMVTIARNEENKFVVSFDLTDANGINYTNTCTIANMSGNNVGDDFVTALNATEALEWTQNLAHTDETAVPYLVKGVISQITSSSADMVMYGGAHMYISEDGSSNNQFYCYGTKWLNNTNYTTGNEIAVGDTVVIYGNLQNYLGSTPEIKGYIYEHKEKVQPEGEDPVLDINFTHGEVIRYSDTNKELHLYSADENTHIVFDLYSEYNNSILGTYIIRNSNNAGDCYTYYSKISFIETNVRLSSGVVTIIKDAIGNLVISFDVVDANGNTFTNTCTIASSLISMEENASISGTGVTALTAVEANSITQDLSHTDETAVPYLVKGIISRITSYDVTQYSRARFYISEDGGTNNEFYCYNTLWLNNSNFTTGNEIAVGDTVVIYGNLQNYNGTTPEIKGYVYQSIKPAKFYYTLSVTASEGGTVNINPLLETYPEGTTVSLSAIANAGYEFVSWSDGVTNNVRTIVMNSNVTLYATFQSVETPVKCYTLTVDATEGGYVSMSPEADCYEEGTEVTLTAIANEGYQFSQWNDGSTENPRTLMMNSNTTLTAEFSRLTYVITNLVITTDCGNASGTWECDAPWYDIRIMDMAGNIQASGIMNSKNVYANSLPEGNYTWWVCPMYSDTEGDYAGEAVEQAFTISLEGCIDPEIYDLTYTTTNDSIVNVTWVSEAPLFQVWMYDSFGELLNSEFLNGNNYCDTLSETGVYQFQIRSVDADTMYYTSPAYYLEIDITIPETPCYTLTVNANDGGNVSVSPLAECYEAGTQVVITATPNENYEFATWSDGNTSAQRTIVMDKDYSLTATFRSTVIPTNNYTLTLTCDEGGTVGKNPDYEYYEENSTVTIFANANEGYKFVQWSDGNTDNVRSITMTQNMVLHATFVEEQKEQFSLTLTAGEGGTVTKTPDQPSYAAGSVVTITAQANEGFEFVSWSDGDKNSVRDITMTQNVELHATFKRIASNYDITNLSVTSSNKRITAKWESIATRFEIVITDRNNEVEHSEKVDITDDSKVYKYTAKKLGTYTVTIKPLNASDQQIGIEDSKTVTLVMKYSLFISTENENAGTVNEEVNGDYVDGETVEIVATPKNGYRFKMWDDGDTNAKRTLVMNQDYYLTASFSRIPTYTLTISEGENGLASMAAGSYTYKENEEVTITPLPYDGYVFDHWIVNGIENTTETLTLVMTQDYSVYPVCVSKPIPTYTLTILPGEYGKANMEAGTYTYQEGEEVTLLPIADTDYLFDQWVVNDEVNTDSVLVLVMDKDYTVMPTFIPNQVGVENIYDGITILVEQWTITVEATQAQDIALYDLVGHLIEQQPHTRIASFTVPSAGLYLIRTSSGVKKVRVE